MYICVLWVCAAAPWCRLSTEGACRVSSHANARIVRANTFCAANAFSSKSILKCCLTAIALVDGPHQIRWQTPITFHLELWEVVYWQLIGGHVANVVLFGCWQTKFDIHTISRNDIVYFTRQCRRVCLAYAAQNIALSVLWPISLPFPLSAPFLYNWKLWIAWPSDMRHNFKQICGCATRGWTSYHSTNKNSVYAAQHFGIINSCRV